MDVAGEPLLYDKSMTRVYLADSQNEERSALRLFLLDLKMEVVGEAADWSTTLAQAPISQTELLLVDWNLLPSAPNAALEKLREACPAALVIVLISHLDARQQAALPAEADAFISKGEMPERVAERLRAAAASIDINLYPIADRKNLKNRSIEKALSLGVNQHGVPGPVNPDSIH
jgi:DNA-binding NarL/FixJ family response regulator